VRATARISYIFGVDEITQTTSTLNSDGSVNGTPATLTFGHDGHGSVRALFNAAAAFAQVYTYTAYGELLAIHNGLNAAIVSGSAGAFADPSLALTKQLYNGEALDARTNLYNFRDRWYSASSARFPSKDRFTGNPTDPFSFNPHGFVHGDPIGMTDPSGLFGVSASVSGLSISVSIGSLSLTANVGAFLGASAASYAIGKGIEATWALAVDGDLENFQWFRYTDLLSFVPGGFIASLYAKFIRYPIAVLTRSLSGKVVGKFFSNGTHIQVANAFAARFAQGYVVTRTIIQNGVQQIVPITLFRGTTDKGFMHLIRRHMAEFYDGSSQAAHLTTGFWPVGTTADDVIKYAGEAMFKSTYPRLAQNATNNLVAHEVLLGNGILTRIVYEISQNGISVHTFFPISGPGVATIQEILAKRLL
jgi:RHS repeat-associated protein